MTKDTKYSIIAALVGVAIACLMIGSGFAGVSDAAFTKWWGFAVWTAAVFGIIVMEYGGKLKKAKPLSLFLAMVALHVSVLVYYLRSEDQFPNWFFLFFFPLEAAVVAFVLVMVGDIASRRERGSARSRNNKPPPNKTEGGSG